mmetsp:Transcript_3087/g.9382  ORF Transcript_3087/g.9382 Transcript_3087/m.9382 type:complete len:139 (+) Transcript_3087:1552-1968(+)
MPNESGTDAQWQRDIVKRFGNVGRIDLDLYMPSHILRCMTPTSRGGRMQVHHALDEFHQKSLPIGIGENSGSVNLNTILVQKPIAGKEEILLHLPLQLVTKGLLFPCAAALEILKFITHDRAEAAELACPLEQPRPFL